MKYIKPHLSPELRAQITPAKRRDVRYSLAGVVFLVLSLVLTYNLFASKSTSPLSYNKPEIKLTQTLEQPAAEGEKQILGVATDASQSNSLEYVVKSGDTLFNISEKYRVKWDLIAQLNNLSQPYLLKVGQTLKIPTSSTATTANKIYTVKSGDTLVGIAQDFKTTVDDIIAVNPNLQKSNLIVPGQVLKLP
jgi:LysM repeat protein